MALVSWRLARLIAEKTMNTMVPILWVYLKHLECRAHVSASGPYIYKYTHFVSPPSSAMNALNSMQFNSKLK